MPMAPRPPERLSTAHWAKRAYTHRHIHHLMRGILMGFLDAAMLMLSGRFLLAVFNRLQRGSHVNRRASSAARARLGAAR
jgi:hypothetical protein